MGEEGEPTEQTLRDQREREGGREREVERDGPVDVSRDRIVHCDARLASGWCFCCQARDVGVAVERGPAGTQLSFTGPRGASCGRGVRWPRACRGVQNSLRVEAG